MQRGEGAVLLFVGIMLIYLSVYGLQGFTASLQSYEVYTKVDQYGLISYSGGVITQQVSRTKSSYMYFDKGTGYFTGTFTHKLDFKVVSAVQYSIGIVYMLSNTNSDSFGLRGSTFVEAGWIDNSASGQSFAFFFRDWSAASGNSQPYSPTQYIDNLAVGTTYYLTINCSGSTMTCNVASAGSITINLPPDGTSFRYVYACSTQPDQSNDANAYPGMQMVEGLDLSGGGSNPTGLAVSISPSSASLTVGQQQTFTATASGGASPYTYQWYLGGSSVSGATSSSYTYSATADGAYTVYCTVKDSASATATSDTVNINVGTGGHGFPDIIQWIQNLLSNGTVQSLMFIVGLMMSGVGGIVLVLPTKHASSPA